MTSVDDWAAKAARRIITEMEAKDVLLGKAVKRVIEERIAAIIATLAQPLLDVLHDARREHESSREDDLDNCPLIREKYLNDRMFIKHECDCGADAWNARIDAALSGEKM